MAKAKAFTKKQESQYNMLERVDSIALRHESTINSVPALRRHFGRMRQIKANLSRTRDARFTGSEGATDSKGGAAGLLTTALQEVGNVLLGFANDTDNHELRALTDRPDSYYTRVRDGELPGLAERYLAAARRYSTELADYGLSDDAIANLEANKGRYEEQAQAPTVAITDGKGNTRDLSTGFTEVNKLLAEKIDPVIRGLRSKYPDLARDYNEARVIRRNPVHRKPETESSL
ncbi:hypothetical protein [Flaviaesturariibacter aridisoli]|uniref:Uncharacterized protein n=1 Tax=Flaviaesturariibacter aridisoli TaxID=2545761 RepID=A0A4R4E0A5_9BACT|nr:hypothetical protein [Flaviaesturariibacter aridisoli]TCZ67469.1 hypothetical protein E0486_15430 [Flaviaesturariibacter aridisoli]